ncbi:MAG: JDVT-CTERM system CAAX-type protease [Deltaproteobacteria bacterium]|nr:JDVT-CTERM system CAAX-type protease [Deltaproteobacteria bacterium]
MTGSGRMWPHGFIVRDPFLWLLMAAGLIGIALPTPVHPVPVAALAAWALAEELIFRFGLQEGLRRWLKDAGLGPLTLANVVTSAVFAGVHFVHHPPVWAVATFVPSLAFGLAWDRYRRLWPCWVLHFFYNLMYFHRI